ncbi:MAG: DivIVA domain-containing protein [Actinomycetota bacterium]
MSDALTPKRIEEQVFAIDERGYNCDEVDAFLRRVAGYMEALGRGETQFGNKPYEALGIEMGDLLQHANDVAAHVKKTAEDEAAIVVQDAHKEAQGIREQAETVKRKLDSEAAEAKKQATQDAQRLKREAAHVRSLAEAEASLMKQDLRKEAKRLKEEAKRRAEAILQSAHSEAVRRARDTELRLRKLQKAEAIMQERLAVLKERIAEAVGDAKAKGVTLHIEKPAEEKPIELPDFVRFDSQP